MLINLLDIVSKQGKHITKECELEMDVFRCRLGVFPIVKKEAVRLELTNAGKQKILLEAAVRLSIAIPCARCLEDVITEFCLDISKELDMSKSEEDRINKLDESNYIVGYDLDVEQLVSNEILLNFPLKVLCSEDCKGICKSCGVNLNTGSCNCDTTVLDPRMAAIKDIFEKYKEV